MSYLFILSEFHISLQLFLSMLAQRTYDKLIILNNFANFGPIDMISMPAGVSSHSASKSAKNQNSAKMMLRHFDARLTRFWLRTDDKWYQRDTTRKDLSSSGRNLHKNRQSYLFFCKYCDKVLMSQSHMSLWELKSRVSTQMGTRGARGTVDDYPLKPGF